MNRKFQNVTPPKSLRDEDRRKNAEPRRDYNRITSLKPEIIDYNEKPIPRRILPPKQPPFVRFMQKYGVLLVMIFVVLVGFAYSRISQNMRQEFEVMQFHSVSADNIDLTQIQDSVENYLGFVLLTEFQHDARGNMYEECAVAYKIVGGAKNETQYWLYCVASYESGHFSQEDGEFIKEDKREYVPVTVKLFIKDGRYSLDTIDALPIAGNFSYMELTVENTMLIMPEKYARRIVGHPTASAELQTMVDKMLGRIW